MSTIFVLRDKTIENLSMMPDSYKDKCDVVFVGSSTIMNAVYPLQLYEDYGISSYNLGCGSQSYACSYYIIKQMLREGNPKLIVLDTYYCFLDDYYLSDAHLHYVTDKLAFPEKMDLLKEIVSEEKRLDFLFNIAIYHNRWEHLIDNDFCGYTEKDRRKSYGAKVHFYSAPIDNIGNICEESTSLPIVQDRYLRMIIELCQEHGVDVLLTLMPMKYTGTYHGYNRDELQRQWNFIGEIAKEYDVPYLNFMYHYNELNLDLDRDSDGESHLNAYGSQKLTSYVGKYLRENYDLPDVRNNPNYEFMDRDYDIFIEYCKKLEAEAADQSS